MEGTKSLVGRGWRYGAALLLVQLAIGCSPAEPERNESSSEAINSQQPASASTAIGDQPLIVAFGDSLFAGYRLDQGEGLVPELGRALAARGLDVQMINAAVSGDTSAAGLQRLDFALDGLSRKPDLVIVGLGGNDMLRGLEPDTTRTNLAAILARLQERGIPAMLTGMIASPNMGPDYAAAFNPIYPSLAEKFDVPLYPFILEGVIGQADLLLPDGIHPNEQGVERVVSGVVAMVAEELDHSSEPL